VVNGGMGVWCGGVWKSTLLCSAPPLLSTLQKYIRLPQLYRIYSNKIIKVMAIHLKREYNLYPKYQGEYRNRYYKSLITKDIAFYVNHKEPNENISVMMFRRTNTPGEITLTSNDSSALIAFQKTTQNKDEWDYVSPTLYRILKKKTR
jgi:hypothetical protein